MKLTAYDDPSLFETLRPRWNELLRRSTADRIFSTWEWQSLWWEAYHPGQLWVVTCEDEQGRLVGLAPWFIEVMPGPERVVRSIGCIEVSDYLEIIVDKTFAEPVLNCFAAFLRGNRHRYDRISLCNLPEESPTCTVFPGILERNGFVVEVSQQEVCPVISLPGSWEEYLSALDKKQRHEIRRKLRRAEGGQETIEWYVVGAQHRIEDEIERFLALMATSHPEKARFLSNPQNVAFFKSLTPAAYEQGWLQMTFLVIDGTPAAAYLNFDYNGSILVYNSGLLPQRFGHLSPGIVLLAYNIRHAIETERRVFDFLRGNEEYKYRLGGKDSPVYALKAHLPAA